MGLFDKFKKKKNNKPDSIEEKAEELISQADKMLAKEETEYDDLVDSLESSVAHLDELVGMQRSTEVAHKESKIVALEFKEKEFKEKFGKEFNQIQHYFTTGKLGVKSNDTSIEPLLAKIKDECVKNGINDFNNEDILIPYLLERTAMGIASDKEKKTIDQSHERYQDGEYAKLLLIIMGELAAHNNHELNYYSNAFDYTNNLVAPLYESFNKSFGDTLEKLRTNLEVKSNVAVLVLIDLLNNKYRKLDFPFREEDLFIPFLIEKKQMGIASKEEAATIAELYERCEKNDEKYGLILSAIVSTDHLISVPTFKTSVDIVTKLCPDLEDKYKEIFGHNIILQGHDQRFNTEKTDTISESKKY